MTEQLWCDFCERMAEVKIMLTKTTIHATPNLLCEDCRGEFSSVEALADMNDVAGLRAMHAAVTLALAEQTKEQG